MMWVSLVVRFQQPLKPNNPEIHKFGFLSCALWMVQETRATLSTNPIIRKLKPIITWAFPFSRTSDNLLMFNKLKFSLLVVTPHLGFGFPIQSKSS